MCRSNNAVISELSALVSRQLRETLYCINLRFYFLDRSSYAEAQAAPIARKQSSFSTGPKCPRCEKTVYFAEEIIAVGQKWHKTCLKCSKSLFSGSIGRRVLGLVDNNDYIKLDSQIVRSWHYVRGLGCLCRRCSRVFQQTHMGSIIKETDHQSIYFTTHVQ